MKVVKINKVGKSTVVEIVDGESAERVYVINKLTNLVLLGNVIQLYIEDFKLFIRYDELENKLGSTDIKDYLNKASAIFLFNQ